MLIEANGASPGDRARLVSPEIPQSAEKCVKFDYHVHGSHPGSLLVLDENKNTIWRKVGHYNGPNGGYKHLPFFFLDFNPIMFMN